MKAIPKILLTFTAIALLATACSDTDEPSPSPDVQDTTTVRDNSIPGWVDLGLPSGLLWAESNLGANAPEARGNYYTWGETTPKNYCFWDTYIHCNGNYDKLTKYCNSPQYGLEGYTDSLTTLEPYDDAATVNLENNARTPTIDEWRELAGNTTISWTSLNGTYGLRYTSTSNGNSIFLPAAGTPDGELAGRSGAYWSSSLYEDFAPDAWNVWIIESSQGAYHASRFLYRSVRAVREVQPPNR